MISSDGHLTFLTFLCLLFILRPKCCSVGFINTGKLLISSSFLLCLPHLLLLYQIFHDSAHLWLLSVFFALSYTFQVSKVIIIHHLFSRQILSFIICPVPRFIKDVPRIQRFFWCAKDFSCFKLWRSGFKTPESRLSPSPNIRITGIYWLSLITSGNATKIACCDFLNRTCWQYFRINVYFLRFRHQNTAFRSFMSVDKLFCSFVQFTIQLLSELPKILFYTCFAVKWLVEIILSIIKES